MSTLKRLMASVPALALMAGCATGSHVLSPAPTREQFLQYAGPPIEGFTYLGHYDGFRTLGGNEVLIWTTINDAYLIKVLDPCPELPFARKVELTSSSRTVTRQFDWVIVAHDRCHIDTIRHIDYGAMKRSGIAGP
ncbi:MAG TPA: DUF6491 family protein [Steroidobacteraceae bacterium]|nr:DUF6491 family protein [Steroidobacteraceae bacterium]